VFRSLLRARRTRPPRPDGSGTVDHSGLEPVLAALASGGIPALHDVPLDEYLEHLAGVDPDDLSSDAALAFWLNLYNAGALDLARRAYDEQRTSVLRSPGRFTRPFVAVGGESLSLDDVEHGKVRRFGDPRIHAALVCGSVSCPTLRYEPYRGSELDAQLEDQMRHFMASGGVVPDRDRNRVTLSRLFLWYGADFARPHRMPVILPARKGDVLRALSGWLSSDLNAWIEASRPAVSFQDYDWSIGCAIRPPRKTG
jgi:hypothetical protein